MTLFDPIKTAIAIFVKTPGLSHVKTRLGHKVGAADALKFYELSLDKIKFEINELRIKLNQDQGQLDVFWAIAEPFNDLHVSYWKDYHFIHQKGEGLGGRISSIYNSLFDFGYNRVILMGGDSPQLNAEDYNSWCNLKITAKQAVIGPAKDGGFYTFIGTHKISPEVWESVNYSQSTTCQQLDTKLSDEGFEVVYLKKEMDIDHFEDLQPLKESLLNCKESSIEKKALIDYISTVKL